MNESGRSSGDDSNPLVEEVRHALAARKTTQGMRRSFGFTDPDAESEVTHDPEGGLIRQVISDEDAERRLPGQGQEPESSRAGVVTPCAKFDSTIDPFDD